MFTPTGTYTICAGTEVVSATTQLKLLAPILGPSDYTERKFVGRSS